MQKKFNPYYLDPIESSIIAGLMQKKQPADIAKELNISLRTLHCIVKRITIVTSTQAK